MIDWTRIIGFDWDAENERKGAEKHRVSQAEAEQAFFNEPLLVLEDDRHSFAETRFHARGRTNEMRRLHITLTLRRDGVLIRPRSVPTGKARTRAAGLDWRRAERVRLPNLQPSTVAVSLRLPVSLLEEIKIAAHKRDVPSQSLIKMWLAEKVG